jgi:hypothetical protein
MKVTLKRADNFIHVLPENEFERDWLQKYVERLKSNDRLLEPHLTRNGGIKIQPRLMKKLELGTPDFRISKQSCLLCNEPSVCPIFKRGERRYDCPSFKPKKKS